MRLVLFLFMFAAIIGQAAARKDQSHIAGHQFAHRFASPWTVENVVDCSLATRREAHEATAVH